MPQITQLRPISNYSQNYRDQIFFVWWKGGKPNVTKLYSMIPPDENGEIPSKGTLANWVKDDFSVRAEELDREFYEKVQAEAMAEKAEMLRIHAGIGKNMREMALSYLNEHKDELTVNASIRMLIEGVRIERDSVGIPEALDKISDKSNEELLGELQKILTDGNIIDVQVVEEDYE